MANTDDQAIEEDFAAALAVIRRYMQGWSASRDGFGFLIWKRNTRDWEGMTEAEALVCHAAWDKEEAR